MATVISIYGIDGSGKSETAKGLMASLDKAYMLKSTTTRQPRFNGDTEYNFVSRKEFERLDMLEWAEFGGNLYGVETNEVMNNLNKDYLFYIAEANGIKAMNEFCKKNNIKNIVIWMNIDKETIRKNLLNSGYSEEEVNKRTSRSNVIEEAKRLNIQPDIEVTELNEKTVETIYQKLTKIK